MGSHVIDENEEHVGFLGLQDTQAERKEGEEEDGFHEGQGSVQAVEGIVEEGLGRMAREAFSGSGR